MKRFTIGVTTHNEEASISRLLESFTLLNPSHTDIIIYDDCSTDRTKEIVLAHPLSKEKHFHAHFSQTNAGTPSVGRHYFGLHAKTEYVTLFDGDDFLDPHEYARFTELAPSGFDIILTSYAIKSGKKITLPGKGGEVVIDDASINRILAGIGGKSYSTRLLAEHGSDVFRGRSDDVRLNLRIMKSGKRRIYHLAALCFYKIEQSRKSTRSSSINFVEVSHRYKAYQKIKKMYGVGDNYIASTEEQLRQIVKKDAELDDRTKRMMMHQLDLAFSPVLLDPEPESVAAPITVPRKPEVVVSGMVQGVNTALAELDAEIRRLEQKRAARRLLARA